MGGHTGHLEATRIALECIDLQLARLEAAVAAADGVLLVTADHGNADEMFMRKKGKLLVDDQGRPQPRTSHTLNPVPFILVNPRGDLALRSVDAAGLASVGTTILELCGLEAPSDWAPGLVG